MRFNRLENENLYPRHYHKRQIPTWRGIKMLREVDRRKRLAAEARVDTLPSKWDIPAREREQGFIGKSTVIWTYTEKDLKKVIGVYSYQITTSRGRFKRERLFMGM